MSRIAMDAELREFLTAAHQQGFLTAENAMYLLELNFGLTEDKAIGAYVCWQLSSDKDYAALEAKAAKLEPRMEDAKQKIDALRASEIDEAVDMLSSDDYSSGEWKKAKRKSERAEHRLCLLIDQYMTLIEQMEDIEFEATSRARRELLGKLA